ncbi:MAG TPA: helix-turn-helix domain-containing protein [Candidatus Baltobacteraceae bacterium]|jgi:transcriptional regulator with XRE-family HTH domain
MNDQTPAWDGTGGTAGGSAFGASLSALIGERETTREAMAAAAGLSDEAFARILAGDERVGLSALARLALALRLKPIEFLQRTQILSLEAYAFGLDPLYFLPEGPVRYDARIYMREINPRHQVPEGDMTRRNPTLKAIADDEILDAAGKVEIELAYLLRTAVQQTGGSL